MGEVSLSTFPLQNILFPPPGPFLNHFLDPGPHWSHLKVETVGQECSSAGPPRLSNGAGSRLPVHDFPSFGCNPNIYRSTSSTPCSRWLPSLLGEQPPPPQNAQVDSGLHGCFLKDFSFRYKDSFFPDFPARLRPSGRNGHSSIGGPQPRSAVRMPPPKGILPWRLVVSLPPHTL